MSETRTASRTTITGRTTTNLPARVLNAKGDVRAWNARSAALIRSEWPLRSRTAAPAAAPGAAPRACEHATAEPRRRKVTAWRAPRRIGLCPDDVDLADRLGHHPSATPPRAGDELHAGSQIEGRAVIAQDRAAALENVHGLRKPVVLCGKFSPLRTGVMPDTPRRDVPGRRERRATGAARSAPGCAASRR